MRVKISVSSIKQVTEALTFLSKATTKAAKNGSREHLELVGTQSQLEVPRLTGKLARSMRITMRERPAVYGEIDYTADYAIPVHEIPEPPNLSVGGRSAHHTHGKWKFLEDPFKSQEPLYRGRVADAVADVIQAAGRVPARSIFRRAKAAGGPE